jgi:hypothetical protein
MQLFSSTPTFLHRVLFRIVSRAFKQDKEESVDDNVRLVSGNDNGESRLFQVLLISK